eukprot:COSAG01_NODE_9657_length_2378_cov_2.215007_3_plen_158_part_00
MWLALDPWGVDAAAGPLRFATRSHRAKRQLPSLRKLPLAQRVASVRHLQDADMEAAVGSVVLFCVDIIGSCLILSTAYQGWNITSSLSPGEFQLGSSATESPSLMAGDASMHLGWTFHTAAGNSAATPRCALAISFFVDGADRVLVYKTKHSCGQIK